MGRLLYKDCFPLVLIFSFCIEVPINNEETNLNKITKSITHNDFASCVLYVFIFKISYKTSNLCTLP